MDKDIFNFAGVMFVCLGTVWGLTAIWTRTRRALRNQAEQPVLRADKMDERFAQLQQSVDAIAVEVERIAEGQRFTSKLLAESNRPAGYLQDR